MNQLPEQAFIALVIIWSLHFSLSASESLPQEGNSLALNLLLEMLVKSNRDLSEKFEIFQETVTTQTTEIADLRLQLSSVQNYCKINVESKHSDQHCDFHTTDESWKGAVKSLQEKVKEIDDKVLNMEQNQVLYESKLEGPDKAMEIVNRVKEDLIVLSKGIAYFKAKLLSNEKLYNDKIGNMENEISELYQNLTLTKNALSKKTDRLENRLDGKSTELSDLKSNILLTDTRNTQKLTNIIRENTQHIEHFVAVKEKVDKTGMEISELIHRVSKVEETYNAMKNEIKQKIQTDNKEQMVAFSARVSTSYKDIQPGTTIIFSNVETNIAKGYNPKTGEFCAPLSGVYVFYSHILSAANKSIETRLVINGKIKLWLYSGGGRHLGSGSNLLVIHLEKEDKVKMVKYGPWGTRPYYIHHVWSTFSGFLLMPDA